MPSELKKTVIESAASDLTARVIALLIPLLLGLVAALIPQVRDRILPVLPKPLLAVIVGISLSLNLALFFYVHRLRRTIAQSRQFTPRFNVLWSRDQTAYCPACTKPVVYTHGPVISGIAATWGFRCMQCSEFIPLTDEQGHNLELKQAKKLLTTNEAETNTKAIEAPKEQTDNLDETEQKLLLMLANQNRDHDEESLIRSISLHPERVKHHLEKLEEGHYIFATRVMVAPNIPTTYHLARKGRDFLLKRKLI